MRTGCTSLFFSNCGRICCAQRSLGLQKEWSRVTGYCNEPSIKFQIKTPPPLPPRTSDPWTEDEWLSQQRSTRPSTAALADSAMAARPTKRLLAHWWNRGKYANCGGVRIYGWRAVAVNQALKSVDSTGSIGRGQALDGGPIRRNENERGGLVLYLTHGRPIKATIDWPIGSKVKVTRSVLFF